MPQLRASEVPGIHSQPPERAVVPPKARLLLDNEDIEAAMARGDRGRQAGTSRADHQRIAFVNLFAARHVISRDLSLAA